MDIKKSLLCLLIILPIFTTLNTLFVKWYLRISVNIEPSPFWVKYWIIIKQLLQSYASKTVLVQLPTLLVCYNIAKKTFI